jgi:hypothetical protein
VEFEVTGLGSVCDSFGIVRRESVRRPSRDSRERARYRDKLREGSIARYWRTWHDANADTAMIAKGKLLLHGHRPPLLRPPWSQKRSLLGC